MALNVSRHYAQTKGGRPDFLSHARLYKSFESDDRERLGEIKRTVLGAVALFS